MSTPIKEVEVVNIEINGVSMTAPRGSMIIEATDKAGIDIPRFCYHKKLSIAANCRMCLVDVEKAPKPLPACATPVMEGMKVFTESRRARDAQHGVMEFLLINHPLDCPICDQGGECELQDTAMGYGRSISRFTERKRVVADHDIGSLVQTDMTRCIHCTRCIRFLDEIAGTDEFGGKGRGDQTEIGTFIAHSIESELSGNIIDLCPVGALTNKPFQYSARAWELVARPAVAGHDGLGSNLYYHCRRGRIMRAVPRENEAINESWLTDRDRYSHFGLDSEDRLREPMVKQNGEWQTVTWEAALKSASGELHSLYNSNDGEALGVLMSAGAFDEEYFLAQKLARGLGCNNIDHRLRESDFRDQAALPLRPRFDIGMADLNSADAVLLVGSNIRHEAPLLGHRLRQASKGGARLCAINPADFNFNFNIDNSQIVAPQAMVACLARVAAAVHESVQGSIPDSISGWLANNPADESARSVAGYLQQASVSAILLGQLAMGHDQAAVLRQLADYICESTSSGLCVLPFGGNPAGAWMAGAIPHRGAGARPLESPGKNAAAMLENPCKAYLLWDFEPGYDTADPAASSQALHAADKVIAVSSFAGESLKAVADVLLPLAPLAESEGSLCNLEGQVQIVRAAVKPMGEARPGWKILRRLGHELGLDGFDYVSLDQVRAELDETKGASPAASPVKALPVTVADNEFHRLGEVPMYSVDALCRRSEPLQQTVHANNDFIGLNPADAGALGLEEGATARISQGECVTELPVRLQAELPTRVVRFASGTISSRSMGPIHGAIKVEAV